MSRRLGGTDLIPILQEFYEKKTKSDTLKKDVENLNKKIKETIVENSLPDKFELGDYKVELQRRQNSSLNELKAIEVLKEKLNGNEVLKSVVKTKEYVDNDALEDKIYNGEIPGDILIDCIENKPDTLVLKVKKSK
jgi:hypothetical protein